MQAMQRILIIGCGGAGKSTLAKQLGEQLSLPVHHLDRLYWRPGWTPAPADEWRRVQQSLCNTPRWIIEGNYGSTMDLRLAACDTVIFLDYPRRVCLWRVIKRFLIYRGRARPDMTEGCPERLTWEFLRWIWRYRREYRPKILAKLNALDKGIAVLVFNNPRQATRALHQSDG